MAAIDHPSGPYPLYRGRVTHVSDPENFFMRIGKGDTFKCFQEKLDYYLNHDGVQELPDSLEALDTGTPVFVKFEDAIWSAEHDDENAHWERANVINVNVHEDTVDVYFIDFGCAKIVELDHLRLANATLFNYMGPQVAQYQLAGIMPLSKKWTKRAIDMFSTLVMDTELVVSVETLESADDFYTVHLFKWCDESSSWWSIVAQMLEEEVGMSTEDVKYCYLADEFVNTAIDRTESEYNLAEENNEQLTEEETEENNNMYSEEITENTYLQSEPNINDTTDHHRLNAPPYDPAFDPAPAVPSDLHASMTSDLCSRTMSPASVRSGALSPAEPGDIYLPSPSDFMSGSSSRHSTNSRSSSRHSTQSPGLSTAGIPKVDVNNILEATRSISLERMHVDKHSEAKNCTRVTLDKDLDIAEFEDDHSSDGEYGPRDSQIAQGLTSPDPYDETDFTYEIYKGYERQCSTEALQPFLKASTSGPSSVRDETSSPGLTSIRDDPQPLTAEPLLTSVASPNDLRQQDVDISRILSDTDQDEECLCALVHTVVEPGYDLQGERLTMTLMSILDCVVGRTQLDIWKAAYILHTYSGANNFDDAFIGVLKTLKQKFVRQPQSVRLTETFTSFATMLAGLFNTAEERWEPRLCKKLQVYILGVVDGWVVFNKHRQQQAEECELMYLSCASSFLSLSHPVVSVSFPGELAELGAEVKDKLLQDGSTRALRSRCLDLLLLLHDQGTLQGTTKCADTSVQTDVQDQGRHTQLPTDKAPKKPVAYYRAPRGSLNPRANPYVPTMFDEDDESGDNEDIYPNFNNDTNCFRSDFNERNKEKDLKSVPLISENKNYIVDEYAQSLLEQSKAAKEYVQNELEKSKKTDEYRPVLSEKNKPLPKALRNLPPRLKKKYMVDNSLSSSDVDLEEEEPKHDFNSGPKLHKLAAKEITNEQGRNSWGPSQFLSGKSPYLPFRDMLHQFNNRTSHIDDLDEEESKCNSTMINSNEVNYFEPHRNNQTSLPPPPSDDLDESDDIFYGRAKNDTTNCNDEEIQDNNPKSRTKTYKYTPNELRELNPYNKANISNGVLQKLRKHRDDWLKLLRALPLSYNLPINEVLPKIFLPRPLDRYNGGYGDAEAPLMLAGGKNFSSWTKLESLLPESRMAKEKVALYSGTSVDPPSMVKPYIKPLLDQKCEPYVKPLIDVKTCVEPNVKSKVDYDFRSKVDNNDIPEDAISGAFTPEVVCQRFAHPAVSNHGDCSHSYGTDNEDKENVPSQVHEEAEEGEGAEMWDEPVWPTNFIQNTNVNVGAMPSTEAEQSSGSQGGKKKKKIKYRPLTDFMGTNDYEEDEEEEDYNTSSKGYTRDGGHDDFGFSTENTGPEEDLYSQEMLEMYMALEEQEKKGEIVVHPPTLEEKTKPSPFAALRRNERDRAARAHQPWVPGNRTCSRCHRPGHLVYDCPEITNDW